jgi:hypothetical protein
MAKNRKAVQGHGLENKLRLGLGVSPLGGVNTYPVYATVTATASKKFRGPKGLAELTKPIYKKIIHVGNLDIQRMRGSVATKIHPDFGLCLLNVGVSMKLPGVVPMDYGMVEVTVGVTSICEEALFDERYKQLLGVVGNAVQNSLDEIATACGGTPPFSAAEVTQAEKKAGN